MDADATDGEPADQTSTGADVPGGATTGADAVHFYWRPGCGFCAMLRRGLDQVGIVTVDHNIWDDPADAAVVREHAAGNETVPTVVVGGVGMVNPSAKQVADHLVHHSPHLLPDGYEPARTGILGRVFGG